MPSCIQYFLQNLSSEALFILKDLDAFFQKYMGTQYNYLHANVNQSKCRNKVLSKSNVLLSSKVVNICLNTFCHDAPLLPKFYFIF